MKCPECGHKLSTKHYDAAYEWYECPKCEGCFTYDEVIEGGISDESDESEDTEAQGNRTRSKRKKKAGGRGKKRAHAERKNSSIQARNGRRAAVNADKNSTPIAKGKKRRTEIEEDEQAVEEYTKQIVTNTVKQESHTRHRDEVDSLSVVNIWGDEIQDVYHDLGDEIDEVNAQDKALIIWREIHHLQGVAARDQAVEHALCKEHQ